MAVPFGGQDFDSLRRVQLSMGELFTDPTFPPNDSSLFLSERTIADEIEWKRPGQICSSPKLVVDRISRLDACQGRLGDCWFIAACSVLALVKEFWYKVVPDLKEQEWDSKEPDKYCGIFHFRFWRSGKWVDVVIDDLLPTVKGELIYARSPSKNVFWCALLEKAYAKLNGCYQSLNGGDLGQGLADFTGGLTETMYISSGHYSVEKKKKDLFKVLLKHASNQELMCCTIDTRTKACG